MLAGPEQSAVEGVGSEEISGAGRAVVKYKTLSASLINTHTSFASVPFTQKAYQTSWTPDLIPQLKGGKKKRIQQPISDVGLCVFHRQPVASPGRWTLARTSLSRTRPGPLP